MDAAENQLDALCHAIAYRILRTLMHDTHVLLPPGDAMPTMRADELRPMEGASLTGGVNMLAFIEEWK